MSERMCDALLSFENSKYYVVESARLSVKLWVILCLQCFSDMLGWMKRRVWTEIFL